MTFYLKVVQDGKEVARTSLNRQNYWGKEWIPHADDVQSHGTGYIPKLQSI